MVLPRASGSFGDVGAMHVGRSQLDLGLLGGDEIEDIIGYFIVEFV